MSKSTRIVVALGTVVFAALILGTCTQRSASRNALARYKADLRAKGEKLSWADLGYPREPEPRGSFDRLRMRTNANLLRSSKLQLGELRLFSFVSAGVAQVSWRMPQPPFNPSRSTNSNTLTWEEVSEEFAMASSTLEYIREATRNPPRYFYHDPTNWINQPKGPYVEMRTAAQWLSGDSMAALQEGQLERAQIDLHALTQLAQFNRDDLTLVSQMIREAIAGLGLAVTWEALQAQGWSEDSLAALQKDWEALDLVEAVEKGMLGQRAAGEAVFSHLRMISAREGAGFVRFGNTAGNSWNEFVDAWVMMPLWRANSFKDELFFLEYNQGFLDSIRELETGVSWSGVDPKLVNLVAKLDKAFSDPYAKFRHRISGILLPNSWRAAKTGVRNETQRRLTVTAIAVERYRWRHGRRPPDLDALVPDFLSTVPLDPMSGGPLRYRLTAAGGFTLYSVGEDGRDDGGNAKSLKATKQFDLWTGQDAVWPAPE